MQCAAPTLSFDDVTMIVPVDPLTGVAGAPGTAGYGHLPADYHDPRLTWTNWDIINGVLWGNTVEDPREASAHRKEPRWLSPGPQLRA